MFKAVLIVATVITVNNVLFKNSIPLGHYFTAEGFGFLLAQFAFACLPGYIAVWLLSRYWVKGDPVNAVADSAEVQ